MTDIYECQEIEYFQKLLSWPVDPHDGPSMFGLQHCENTTIVKFIISSAL